MAGGKKRNRLSHQNADRATPLLTVSGVEIVSNPRANRFRKSIRLSILLPVLVAGIGICIVSANLIAPPILDDIQSRIDSELKHAVRLGLTICETHLNYLLDLRLEDDREMNTALRREAAGEIERIGDSFKGIRTMVVGGDGRVHTFSEQPAGQTLHFEVLASPHIQSGLIGGKTARMYHLYFPFWDWHVVGYIHEKDYQAPLSAARRAIYAGTFGVMAAIWLILLVVVNRLISGPLGRLADATRKVAEGELTRLENSRNDEIGQVVETFNTMVDSLEKKNREVSELIEALIESEKRYRDLFDGAAEGILVAELASKRIRYANPAICTMLGYQEAQLTGMGMLDLYPRDDHTRILTLFETQNRPDGKIVAADLPCLTNSGERIYADVKATLVDFDGVRCILGFFTDVTARLSAEKERKELENRLHRSEKMEAIGLLAGGVAHDLNNILSGLVSYPELLLMDLPESSPMRGPVKTIEKSGKRAAAIVQDLLTLARRGVAVSQVTNLNRIVTEYLQSPEHEKLRKYHPGVTFGLNLAENLLDILGSPVHLAKTVMNLVSNAAEAIRSDVGRIMLSTRNQYVDRPIHGYDEVEEGDYAVLTVADEGIGIAREDLKRIFEPFYSKKVMGRSGTGLGMAVVWGTVKDHNGYIDVLSIPDQGTTFELYFPVTRKTRESESDTQLAEDLTGNGESILVVDDVADQRDIAARILTRLGYCVKTAPSGEAAVTHMQRGAADLLILDMIMDPGMDGLDTYREILKLRPGQRAIIASGFSENERVREAQRLGARQYIKKPYTLEAIAKAVKTELDQLPENAPPA
jgi:PAS domain S-box-containing protein